MGFPNLARGEPTPEEVDTVTAICRAELEAAGIKPYSFGSLYHSNEVPSKCVGGLSGWSFERAWYYWRAKGPGIPPEIAERLHATHGRDVRVEGHCGCPSPLEWAHGFAIGSYHIDTPEGLKALADTLRSIWDNPDDRPTSAGRTGSGANTAEDRQLRDTQTPNPNSRQAEDAALFVCQQSEAWFGVTPEDFERARTATEKQGGEK